MSDATAPAWSAYSFAVLKVVPHPHLGIGVPVGVLLHARTKDFLGIQLLVDADELKARCVVRDLELLGRYLEGIRAICEGVADAGPVALAPPSERFHWLTAPRSDVIQSGPVHAGLCLNPAEALAELFAVHVRGEEVRSEPRIS
ncbi:DUF3037 domain-containing protein [Longimicrobium terrae]|uniref:DUF3037 domain-containing protein n=1 Tax=Longimicrobium terrae TaxID=1639882 RepID=A0A841H880_9BACT|nr:DUF3037 domain-containing protein [Longimicrobium terrae]MBB4639705.1 hypothetical protein [Longimicrobium terrae]MBB6074102.1 hypothetical protein [Longimicrobium terrae]NNC32203.1 DUF3037 domain-containing protein [Longimicrobium terrae]